MSKVKMVCTHCGSDDVTSDAVARWDVEKQSWEMSDHYDDTWCASCEGECDVIGKAVE